MKTLKKVGEKKGSSSFSSRLLPPICSFFQRCSLFFFWKFVLPSFLLPSIDFWKIFGRSSLRVPSAHKLSCCCLLSSSSSFSLWEKDFYGGKFSKRDKKWEKKLAGLQTRRNEWASLTHCWCKKHHVKVCKFSESAIILHILLWRFLPRFYFHIIYVHIRRWIFGLAPIIFASFAFFFFLLLDVAYFALLPSPPSKKKSIFQPWGKQQRERNATRPLFGWVRGITSQSGIQTDDHSWVEGQSGIWPSKQKKSIGDLKRCQKFRKVTNDAFPKKKICQLPPEYFVQPALLIWPQNWPRFVSS